MFGPDEPLEESSSELLETVSTSTIKPFEASSTTEKSFFDILKAGLELIDANSESIGAAIGQFNNTLNNRNKLNATKPNSTESEQNQLTKILSSESQIKKETEKPLLAPKTTQKPTVKSTTATVRTTKKPQQPVVTTKAPKLSQNSTVSNSNVTHHKPQATLRNTTSKYVPSSHIRRTTESPIIKLKIESYPFSSTTLKPRNVTKEPTTISNKVTTTSHSTSTTEKSKTTPIDVMKPSRINDKLLDGMLLESTSTSTVQTPTTHSNIEDKKEVQRNATTTAKPISKVTTSRPSKLGTTTESIFNAFLSGLSSIFDTPPEPLKKKVPNLPPRDKVQVNLPSHLANAGNHVNLVKLTSSVGVSPYTHQPPIAPATPPPMLEMEKPKPIPIKEYDYDYSAPTLPPSLPNLKIIPFLPTDAVDKVNYYKPNPIPLSENLEKYGSPGATKNSDPSYIGLDYGGPYDPYLVYSTIQDSVKDKTEVSKLSITENYEGKPTAFPKFDKTKLNSPNHVRYNNKFIHTKYEGLDYDFNPNEKIDTYDSDIKYIPNKYEAEVYGSDYNQFASNGGVYPTDSTSQGEKYYYGNGDGYENVYDTGVAGLPGSQFSPPKKTEGKRDTDGHILKF